MKNWVTKLFSKKYPVLKKGKLKVENNEFTGVLVLSSEKDLQLKGSIYEKEHINKVTLNQLNETLATYNMQKKAQNLKLNASDIQYISQNHIVHEKLINEDAEEKDNSLFLIYVVYGLVFLLYGSVMIFSNMIAQDIASEKSSRVMEIIMSSTKPIFHMYGKITGIGLVGITQIVTFLLTVEVFSLINKENFLQSFIDSGIDIKLLTFAIVSFLVGYLIYSLIAAVVGSIVSTIQEVQQLYLPIMLLLFFSFFYKYLCHLIRSGSELDKSDFICSVFLSGYNVCKIWSRGGWHIRLFNFIFYKSNFYNLSFFYLR
ncbi:ABC transporter permease [Bacillus velezensis]